MDKPLVSVVVPTFNSERFLERCLKSISEQSYSNIEVIVVDNYSEDKTKEIAEKYADLVMLKGSERSVQVNFGVKHAHGEYIYRVDSDFVVEPAVVEEAIRRCEVEGFDAVCVHNTSDPSVSFWAKVRKLERDCYADDYLNVAARFFRKEIFEKIGGFDERLIAAEDYDLHNRLLEQGYKITHIKSKEIHIGEPRSLSDIAKKHYYYGKTIGKFIGKNPEKSRKQLSPFRAGYVRHRKDFLRHPSLTIGFVVYQSVRYGASFAGFIADKVKHDLEHSLCVTKD
jgi:glycosyltransferase involved in cell wall biosynthesis